MDNAEILDKEIPKKAKSIFKYSTLVCNLSFIICLALQMLDWRQLHKLIPVTIITPTLLLYLYGYIGLVKTSKWNGFFKSLLSGIIIIVFTVVGSYVLSLFITIIKLTFTYP
jgi:hypothetical protein